MEQVTCNSIPFLQILVKKLTHKLTFHKSNVNNQHLSFSMFVAVRLHSLSELSNYTWAC